MVDLIVSLLINNSCPFCSLHNYIRKSNDMHLESNLHIFTHTIFSYFFWVTSIIRENHVHKKTCMENLMYILTRVHS
jgi:hypothetical protein